MFRELKYQKTVFLYQKFSNAKIKVKNFVAKYSALYLYSNSVTREIKDTCDGEYKVRRHRFQVSWLL